MKDENRPYYADYDSAAKFQAIQGIIITRLRWHPKAICSYSGGSDSVILIDMIERTRSMFNSSCGSEAIKPIKYVFFNTGLEMKATKDHVKATAEKYGVEIEECRPKIGIVQAVKKYGVPFYTKHFSERLSEYQKKHVPLSIINEFHNATDKPKKFHEIHSDKDKAWYKSYYNIRYSDAYEVYGLKRTGCCGCPISSSAIDELEKVGMYEPNIAKAAWNIFGDSYRYRQKYNEYKAKRREEEKRNKDQITFEEGDNL